MKVNINYQGKALTLQCICNRDSSFNFAEKDLLKREFINAVR